MKRLVSVLLTVIMILSLLPVVSFAETTTMSVAATKAFSWNYTTNAQNGGLPTSVSWGDYRACFMTFEIPAEVLEHKGQDALIVATLKADMTFNNGRVSGQAPVVTIIEADGEAINGASLSGGSSTSEALKKAWEGGQVLGEFDTLTENVSPQLDITSIVNEGKTTLGLYITCRSEEGYYKTNGIVNFNSPVLTITAGEKDEEFYLNNIVIPYNMESGYALPSEVLGQSIKWSENVINETDKTIYKTLTATVNGKSKDFDVMIMSKNENYILAYTTADAAVLGKSMHLALKGEDGWEKLNFGIGVLFAKADLDDGTAAGTTKVLEEPYIYRKDNGKIGVAARCTTDAGVRDEFLTLWETDNLVDFEMVGTAETVEGYDTVDRIAVDEFSDASCIFPVTDSEMDYLAKKLREVKNVSVDPINVNVKQGEKITELPSLTANYSDGSTAQIPVEWDKDDLNAVDVTKMGAYTVLGKAAVAEYPSPMFYGEADPMAIKYNDKYYFIATNETGGQVDLYIRESDTLEGLQNAEEVLIFKHTSSGDHSGCNWAPELHVIGGDLYCLFASSTNGRWSAVQSRVMKCTGDPMNINDWEAPIRVTRKDGSNLINEGITLDMTYFEAAGKHYYVWAERPITSLGNGNSYLVIAEMNPSDPTKITSDPVIIRIPDFGWDRNSTTVDEGPFMLKHDGKLFLTFSGAGTNHTYCVGLLTADEGADLLDVNSWHTTGYPILASDHVPGQVGPGHNAFTRDEYGRDVLVTHMRPNNGTRSGTMRTVHYAFDGTPVLYMTAERYLKSEYRDVTATIYVRGENTTDEEFEIESIINGIEIPNSDNVKGHVNLPLEVDGAKLSWTSDNAAITNDGVVTRGEIDKKVTLTVVAEKNGLKREREIELIVKAKPEKKEKVGYIYAYFRGGVNGEQEVQQIHLAISDDGLNWRDLNGNHPVLVSDMGTKGLRDPYIIRSYEGDKFYLMATDLDSNGGLWNDYGTNGSKSLMFWESDDLVNWSEQRMIKVSNENMGCTWAPEAIYDEENKQYVIYWSSSDMTNDGKKSVYYATTRDFVTFSEPKVFVDGSKSFTVIDTSMVKGSDGRYYRFTKREDNVSVFMEVSDSVLGEYTRVGSNIEGIYGVEGPAIFEMIDGKYCLMLDGYRTPNKGVGFFPLISEDIASGQFTRLTEGFKMPTGAKHGVMLTVTQDEYDAIMEKWGPYPDDDTVLEYNFDGEEENIVLHGNATVKDGVLTLDGSTGTYASLGRGILDRRENFTVSMDVLSKMESGFFFTFAIGNDTSDYLYLRIRGNQATLSQTISGNRYERQINYTPDVDLNEDWHNYTMVGENGTLTLYIDYAKVGSVDGAYTLYHLGEDLPVNLGKSTFSADAYFNGSFDNIKIFNRALAEEEVIGMSNAEELFNKDVDNIKFVTPNETTADLMLPETGEKSGCKIEWRSSDPNVITHKGVITRGDTDNTITMTATFTLGELTAERTYEFTVLKKEEDSAYLFAYFTGNSANQERLFYGVSRDGYNFRALNGGNSVLTSDLGTGCIRDPFIMKGEDGYYYIIATDMQSSLGWASNYAIVVYKTPDLINIVDKEWINYRNFPTSAGCTRAWAPQAIWCPEKNAYMIYLALSIPGTPYGTIMYRNYATDLCDASTYTDVELMLDEPAGTNAGAIDGDIIYDKFHDEYIMYYDGKRVSTSKTISGTWTHAETKYDDGQVPMYTEGGVAMGVEGSNIWKIIGEDKWVIAADGTPFNGGCYALVETTDFENYNQLWASKGEFSFDFTPRHGYVIPISERELNNLFEKYGKIDLPTNESKTYQLNVDIKEKGVDINPDMYGVFYEDINYAADGGLYSEVVENRSFEAAHCNPDRGEVYTKIPSSAWSISGATAEYLSDNPLNENNTTYIRLKTKKGNTLSNECYGGFSAKEGEIFDVSFFARGEYNGIVTVSIVDGDNILGSCDIAVDSDEFKKYKNTLLVETASKKASVKLSFQSEGTIDLDMISVMSQYTFNGRNNGLRKDLVQMLYDLHPAFMRFPGGCVVEGYYLDNRYDWKASIGPVEERKENWNRWQTGSNAYDYCQTLGLGFYEYFLLCEDIGAKALPVVSVGIGCQYQSGEVSSWEDLYNVYIQDAIDLIEFANGDPETNKWAAIRAEMGHPEPFNLEYLGIGNEQWYTAANRFFERYEAFEEEIHKLYPDIKLISTSGPSSDGTHYDNAWNWLKTHNGEENFTYAVDEHYYRTPEWFLSNVNRYDKYDREGFSVFAGEYAANGTYGNTLYSALAEAAYMTGLERNADIVKLASYAPLLAKTGYNQWSPNLIWFNNMGVYGSPDYYVQKMFAEHNGSYTVKNELEESGKPIYNVGVGTWSTAAQFKDITVEDIATGEVVDVAVEKNTTGTWTVTDGVIAQSDTSVNGAFRLGEVPFENYILKLKAKKTAGNEGFLIPVQYTDSNNYIFWNIGGWGNTSHAVQRVVNGSKSTLTSNVLGGVNSNEWYDISIRVEDDWMHCYINDELIHSVNIALHTSDVYSTVSVDEQSGDIIVKLVNVAEKEAMVNINIENADYIAPDATEIILTGSNKGARNSHDNPLNVTDVHDTFSGASDSFTYELDALSFVVLRLHTAKSYVEDIETVFVKASEELPEKVLVTLSDGSKEERFVTWDKESAGMYYYGGLFNVEGEVEGTSIKATATVEIVKGGRITFTDKNSAIVYAENEATVKIAVFDQANVLVSVETKTVTGENEIKFTPPAKGRVKVMLWDNEMLPLCEACEKEY